MRSLRTSHVLLTVLFAFGGLLLVAMNHTATPLIPRIDYGPHPRDMVQIYQNAPYTVPAGKVLVITALGGPAIPSAGLDINGQRELTTNSPVYATVSMLSVPVGLTAPAGAVVEAVNATGARVWAYLADANSAPSGNLPSVRVTYTPPPRDMIQITEGIPYVVPTGKVFVLTALGRTTTGTGVTFRVNGQADCTVFVDAPSVETTTRSIPLGRSVQAGSTIEVDSASISGNPGRALGYLADL